jgi:hypothetical protein
MAVAMLRSVNLPSYQKIDMEALKRVCENSISKLSPAGTAELSPGR